MVRTVGADERIFEACGNADSSAPIIDDKSNDLWLEFSFSPEYLRAIRQGEEGTLQRELGKTSGKITDPVTDPVHRVVLALAAAEMAPSALSIRLALKHPSHL